MSELEIPVAVTATWPNELILVCRKCQKKLKHHPHAEPLAHLRRWFKKHLKKSGHPLAASVVETACFGLCPKDGVTIALPSDLANHQLRVLYSESDIDSLYHHILAAQPAPSKEKG